MTGGEVAAAPAKVTRSKAAGKRHIIVGEDAMGKKAKSVVKKVEVEVVSKTKVKGIKNKSIIDLAFDETDMKKPGTNIKKKAKGHGKKPTIAGVVEANVAVVDNDERKKQRRGSCLSFYIWERN